MTRTRLLTLISLFLLCPAAAADQVNFTGEFTTEFGTYGGANVGDTYSINIFYTSVLAGSGIPSVVIDAAYMYVGAERWALDAGASSITVDAATDTATFTFDVSDSTPGGFSGGSVGISVNNADDVISVSEATEANILATLFQGTPDGLIFFAPDSAGPLIGSAVAVPEPVSVIAFSGLGLLLVAGQLRLRKKRRQVAGNQSEDQPVTPPDHVV